MDPTNVADVEYYHKVVDCQYACPAHTPVPEYIRLVAAGKFTEAYMVNWESNVFPGVLGRTCDRPCEPACRRGRIDEEQVAICRLKRVAADNKGDISHLLPDIPAIKNSKKIIDGKILETTVNDTIKAIVLSSVNGVSKPQDVWLVKSDEALILLEGELVKDEKNAYRYANPKALKPSTTFQKGKCN